MSFNAATEILLASRASVPISQLKPGDKVLATNVKTGRTQAELVTAVLVRRDTNLYDLTVKVGRKTGVIHTTASHLFWNEYHWVASNKLSNGEHLLTANGTLATVIGGSSLRSATGLRCGSQGNG